MNTKILFALTLCSACAAEPAPSPQTGTTDQDMISLNGTSLSGTSLTGNGVSGTSLTGLAITGVNVTGTSAASTPVSTRTGSAAPWSGAQLVGSTWTATTSASSSIKLRIDAATAGTGANTDLWFYTVSYQTSSGWSPLCGLDSANHPVQAIAVAGTWGPQGTDAAAYVQSASQFTVACRAKTIAKCVELGYKTFDGYADQLQACVRLLRADYCGDGTPHTVDGTTLNLFDDVGVQSDTEAWQPEAAWDADGATCINSNASPRYLLVSPTPPSCAKNLMSSSCGTKFSGSTLFIDELSPDGAM